MHHPIPPDQPSIPYIVNFRYTFSNAPPHHQHSMQHVLHVQLHVARIMSLFRPAPALVKTWWGLWSYGGYEDDGSEKTTSEASRAGRVKALEPWLPAMTGLLQAHLEKASAKATCKKGFAQKSTGKPHVATHKLMGSVTAYDKLASTRRKLVFALDFRSMWQAHDTKSVYSAPTKMTQHRLKATWPGKRAEVSEAGWVHVGKVESKHS